MTSQKFFSETVTVTGGTAISVASLMRTAGYGFEKDSDNAILGTPSMDSFIGDQLFLIAEDETLYVGHDQFVGTAAAAGPPRVYKGVPAEAAASYNVVQPMRGIIDANAVWVFCTNTQGVAIVFVAS